MGAVRLERPVEGGHAWKKETAGPLLVWPMVFHLRVMSQ